MTIPIKILRAHRANPECKYWLQKPGASLSDEKAPRVSRASPSGLFHPAASLAAFSLNIPYSRFARWALRSIQLLALALFISAGTLPFSHGVLAASTSNPAQRLSVIGLLDFYSPSVDSSNSSFSSLTNSSKAGWGFGVLGENTVIDTPLGIELGLIFVRRQNEFGSSALKYTQASSWLTVPLSLKFRFAEILSVGIGPYLAYRVSDVSNDFSSGDSSLISFDTTSQERLEFGFQVSAGVTIPVTDTTGLIVEGRYLRGVSNLSENTSTNIKSADIVGLAGVQFKY